MDYKHLAGWAAAATVALGLAYVAFAEVPAAEAALASTLAPQVSSVPAPLQAQALPAAAPPPAHAASTPPYGLTPDQWQQLQLALADHPQRDAEMARIGAYMAYMQTAQRFRQLRQQTQGAAASEELKSLARTLESGMQTHLDQCEMTAGEALLLRSATLDVLQPDAALRQQALAVWQQSLTRTNTAHTPDPRDAKFARQQAELVARWSALPPAQRDPRTLEAQLDTLRQGIFKSPP